MQKRIVSVESAQELPNLIGNHCAETPFQYLNLMTPSDAAWVAGRETRARHFKTSATLGV
jgi:hypothetical protein